MFLTEALVINILYSGFNSTKRGSLEEAEAGACALLGKHFEVLVDCGHSQQDTSARANSAHKVSEHRQSTNAQTTKGSGSGDVTTQLTLHGFGTET